MDVIKKKVAIDAVYEAFCYAYCDNCEKNLDEDLCGDCHRKYQNWSASYKTIEKVINALPSAQPEPQWIPCSERLPEDLEEVNVTWVNHDPEPYYDFTKDKPATASAVYYKKKWYWYSSVCTDLLAEYGENEVDKMDDAIEVIAWMPLPEPWRGEEHEL